MARIEGIQIKNYGVLKDVVLGKTFSNQSGKPLGNLTAVIGSCGSGKSTMADVFGFISDCLSLKNGVEGACEANNRGGFDALRSIGANEPISFEIYYREKNNARPITYELQIDVDRFGRPYILEERLRQRIKDKGRPLSFLYLHKGKGYAFVGTEGGQDENGVITGEKCDVDLADIRRPGIVTLGAMKQYNRIERFLDFLNSWYLCYFSPEAAREMQTSMPQSNLNRIGNNINNVAQFMYRDNPKVFEKVLEGIQQKLPGITKIEPKKLETSQMVLRFFEHGFDKPIYSNRMSDGTLKLFAYYLLLHEKNPRQFVFMEEPENGLYHQFLGDLAGEIKSMLGNTTLRQFFVTTHSPFFVNALTPDDVWVLEKGEDGFSHAKRASEYEFVKELSEEGVALGDMWYSKYFG